jgi:cell surface protein SprA
MKRTSLAVLGPTACVLLLSSCSDNSTEPNTNDMVDSVLVNDIDYVKRKYYRLADPEVLATGPTLLPVTNFELFLDDHNPQNDIAEGAVQSFAFIDVAAGTEADTTGVHRGFFHRLEVNQDYTVIPQTGEVVLETPLPIDQALAMFYVTADGDTVGDLTAGPGENIYHLQILAPPQRDLYDDSKGFAPARKYEMKNVYFLQAKNILPESLELVIRRKTSVAGEQDLDIQNDPTNPANNAEYVRILGLDSRGIEIPIPISKLKPSLSI